jgi:hypothetical protein
MREAKPISHPRLPIYYRRFLPLVIIFLSQVQSFVTTSCVRRQTRPVHISSADIRHRNGSSCVTNHLSAYFSLPVLLASARSRMDDTFNGLFFLFFFFGHVNFLSEIGFASSDCSVPVSVELVFGAPLLFQ